MNYIESYLNEINVESALLIKGKWGCGKTHYYNTVIKDVIEKHNLIPVYISVYGRKSTAELKSNIMSEFILQQMKKIHMDQSPKDNKLRRSVRHIHKVSQNRLAKYGLDISEIGSTIFDSTINGGILKILEEINKVSGTNVSLSDIFSNFNKIVLVIDDFERSRIDIVELMGSVYRLIEEESIKTILIANEEEIQNTLITNNEMKIDSSINALRYKNNEIDDGNDIYNEISLMKSKLFNDQYHYVKMKEKLIGSTIEVKQDITKTIGMILKDNVVNHESVLLEMEEELIELFMRSSYKNYRLLIRAIKLVSIVELSLDVTGFTNKEVLSNTLKNYFTMGIIQYIETKISNKEDVMLVDVETQDLGFVYGEDYPETIKTIYKKYNNNSSIGKLFFFNSLQVLISTLEYDEEKIYADINALYNVLLPLTGERDPLIEVMGFRLIETEKISSLIEKIIENVNVGKYNILDFEKAFRAIIFFSDYRIIEMSKQDIYNVFLPKISFVTKFSDDESILYGQSFRYSVDDEGFSEIINKINDETVKNIEGINKDKGVHLFNSLELNFEENLKKFKQEYYDDYKLLFFSLIESKEIFEKIFKLNEEDYYDYFAFITERRDRAYNDAERNKYQELKEYIIEQLDQLKGLKYYYCKILVKE